MLGLCDRIYIHKKSQPNHRELEDNCKFETLCFPETLHEHRVIWFCFVPRLIAEMKILRRGIIPRVGLIKLYVMSSKNLIGRDPRQSVRGLEEVYQKAFNEMTTAIHGGWRVNLLGVSLGNVISIRAAAELPEATGATIGHLVSIVGGAHLGFSAWDSPLTHAVAMSSGLRRDDYEAEFASFSPAQYVRDIDPSRITARFGTSDKIIGSRHGRELINSFKQLAYTNEVDCLAYPFLDHGSAIFATAMENRIFRWW
jgi:hypothetical protein